MPARLALPSTFTSASRKIRAALAVRRVPLAASWTRSSSREGLAIARMAHLPQALDDVLESGRTHRQILCRASRHLTPMPHSLLHMSHVDMLMMCAP